MTKFYFMRHGECEANIEQKLPAQSDSPLAAKGRSNAKVEGDRLAENNTSFDLIVSSQLSRAYDTACIIADAVKYPRENILRLHGLNERNFGDYQNISLVGLDTVDLESKLEREAESFEQFKTRVSKVLQMLRKISRKQNAVLIVGHGAWYRMLMTIIEGGDHMNFMQQKDPPQSSLVELSI